MNILFVLKQRHNYNESDYSYSFQSGLLNSAAYVKSMLVEHGFNAHLVEVVDNNEIDKNVVKYSADIVVIEALWCVPEKFRILQKLHPKVKWIIAVHSEIPFLSNEGNSMKWISNYLQYENVYVSFNSYETYKDMKNYIESENILYLPNYYPVANKHHKHYSEKEEINIGCFGALRPLKNQLIQAMASIIYAKKHHKKLYFHINSTRIDNVSAFPVLENIRNMFSALHSDDAVLVEHSWLSREHFLKLLDNIDISLQVSFSESFNIVCADSVSELVPTVVSKEIKWMPENCKAECTSISDIIEKIEYVLEHNNITKDARNNLLERSEHSAKVWQIVLNQLK